MAFQDVTFYLRVRQAKILSCIIFLTVTRWILSKCRFLTILMLHMQVPSHMGNSINKSMDLERPKKHDRIAGPEISSPYHLVYFLKL